jgi:hypothetical protein
MIVREGFEDSISSSLSSENINMGRFYKAQK